MKKIFAILAVLSLLMVPCFSMAATMSDADLAAITGQSGVTIEISSLSIDMYINTLTWGDWDGFTGNTDPGFINIEFFPLPMHIGIAGTTTLLIDVGGNTAATGPTKINIAGTMTGAITIDAIIANIFVDGNLGAAVDYLAGTNGNVYVHQSSAYAKEMGVLTVGTGSPGVMTSGAAGIQANLGVVGVSGISIQVPSFNIAISAH